MTTLHILRKKNDHLAEAVIRAESQSAGAGDAVAVLLVQDAVLDHPEVSAPVYVNAEDLQARGGRSPNAAPKLVDYDRVCQLILEHGRTVVW